MRPLDRPANSRRQILAYVGGKNLSLFAGAGVWYFLYDDGKEECRVLAVRTPCLRDKTLGEWVDIASDFAYPGVYVE